LKTEVASEGGDSGKRTGTFLQGGTADNSPVMTQDCTFSQKDRWVASANFI
jgi:hypothetical protein